MELYFMLYYHPLLCVNVNCHVHDCNRHLMFSDCYDPWTQAEARAGF